MGSVHGGELAALQVDVRKFLARKPGWSRFVFMNFLKKPCIYFNWIDITLATILHLFYVFPTCRQNINM